MDADHLRSIHDRSSHKAKELLVHLHGPGDLGIRVFLGFEDGCHYGGEPGPKSDQFAGDDGNFMWQLLKTSVGLLYHRHGHVPVDHMFVTCEGYMKFKEDGEIDLGQYERGDFEKEFRDNPATDIKEVLMTHVLDTDAVGQPWIGSVIEPYHYDDGGVLCWGTVFTTTPESDNQGKGLLVEALIDIWRMTHD